MYTHALARRWHGDEDRLRLTLEILAVFALGVLPHLFAAFSAWLYPALGRAGSGSGGGYAGWSYSGIVHSLQVIFPLLFIMWRSGVPWRGFGIVPISFSFDLVLSLLYLAVSWASYMAFALALSWFAYLLPIIGQLLDVVPEPSAHIELMHTEIRSQPDLLFYLWMIINGLAEELVTKAYLIPRLRTFFGSSWLAVLVSAAAFASYHIYHGSYGMLLIFAQQVLLGFAFLKLKRLWPFALGHALYDILIRVAM